MTLPLIAACLVVLWLVSRQMTRALTSLARDFQVPESVAGATLTALGTGAPALGIACAALVAGHRLPGAGSPVQPDLDLGYATVLGAAIFNLCLLIGIPAMMRPLALDRRALRRDGLAYFAACLLTVHALADGAVVLLEAVYLLLLYALYLAALIRDVWKHPEGAQEPGDHSPPRAALTLLGGLVGIALASGLLAHQALAYSASSEYPTAIVGLGLAVGIALPGLFAAISAARDGRPAVALATAMGSGCFNLCVALGAPALLHAVTVGPLTLGEGPLAPHVPGQLPGDLLWITSIYLALTLAIALLLLLGRMSIERAHGAGLIALYPVFLLLVGGLWTTREQVGPRVPLWNAPLPIAVLGAVGCVAALLAMLAGTRLLLSRGGSVFAVARHVVEEALKAKAALVPIAMLLLLMPIMPMALGEDEVLRHRIQSCLAYTLMLASILLSLMTVLLATSTLSGEIFGRQIYTVIVKPVRRGQYLVGRWVGLMWLNGILLALTGVVVYTLVHTLAALPDVDRRDRRAVIDEVLVARAARAPRPPRDLDRLVQIELDRIRAERPELDDAQLVAIEEQVTEKVHRQWYSLAPRARRTYVFEGLGGARSDSVTTDSGRGGMTGKTPLSFLRSRGTWPLDAEGQLLTIETGKHVGEYRVLERVNATEVLLRAQTGETELTSETGIRWRLERAASIQLRLRVHASRQPKSGQVRVLVQLGRRWVRMPLAVDQTQTFPLNASLIDNDGTLRITILNQDLKSSEDDFKATISIGAGDGIAILYRVDDFGWNLLRALLIIWIKLGFLAALGLAAASYMTFPVACLLCMVALFVVNASGFLLDASDMYNRFNREAVVAQGVGNFVGFIATAANKYATFDPADRLVDGRNISWGRVLDCFVWIGLFWTGAALFAGYLIFRLRELARVLV